MNELIEIARRLRQKIEYLAINLDDQDALDNIELFGTWKGNGVSYNTGDRVRYNGVLYKVLQDHTSQEGWTPESAPSLFAKVLIPDPQGEIPVWEQPSSTSFYNIGDKVHYPTLEDPVYISLVDYNVWPPLSAPGIWELVSDESESDIEPEPEQEPVTEPDHEPIPEPTPEPDPDQDPEPEPTPEPDPEPEPEPTPEPEPEPTPESEPTPDPTPEPEPSEDPEPSEEIPEFVQPDSTNPYMTGDKVRYGGKTWVCIIDNCVWAPGIYGWSEVTE